MIDSPVKKSLSPQITGEECPVWATAFHSRSAAGPNSTGTSSFSASPLPKGPRKAGHSPARPSKPNVRTLTASVLAQTKDRLSRPDRIFESPIRRH